MSRHVAFIIKEVIDRGAATVQPTAEAEAEWVGEIRRLSGAAGKFFESCTPGYFNNEGKKSVSSFIGDFYTPGSNAFNKILKEWREAGTLAGLELS
jgi:cyclohexanone monooxygenase